MSDIATWNNEQWPTRVEPTPRWVRVRAGDILIADSRRAMLLTWYGPGLLPTYCLPADDVRTGLLYPSPPGHDDDGVVGRFRLDHDVRTGDLTIERAAHLFRDPPESMAALDGYWTFTWDAGLSWFEEALEVHVHARDPTKRVDAIPSERSVRVELDGEVIAESSRAHALFETTLPTRWYLPAEDVRRELLVPSDTTTQCPYKGTASYQSVRTDSGIHEDIAWTYPDPIVECPRIAGLISFFNERVDLVVDGVREDRPNTPWSS